jgi:hypothetical protein
VGTRQPRLIPAALLSVVHWLSMSGAAHVLTSMLWQHSRRLPICHLRHSFSSHLHAGCRAGFENHDGAQDGGSAEQQCGDYHGGENGDGHRQVLPRLAVVVSRRSDQVVIPVCSGNTTVGLTGRPGFPLALRSSKRFSTVIRPSPVKSYPESSKPWTMRM